MEVKDFVGKRVTWARRCESAQAQLVQGTHGNGLRVKAKKRGISEVEHKANVVECHNPKVDTVTFAILGVVGW